jgi:hypothetical protein
MSNPKKSNAGAILLVIIIGCLLGGGAMLVKCFQNQGPVPAAPAFGEQR